MFGAGRKALIAGMATFLGAVFKYVPSTSSVLPPLPKGPKYYGVSGAKITEEQARAIDAARVRWAAKRSLRYVKNHPGGVPPTHIKEKMALVMSAQVGHAVPWNPRWIEKVVS